MKSSRGDRGGGLDLGDGPEERATARPPRLTKLEAPPLSLPGKRKDEPSQSVTRRREGDAAELVSDAPHSLMPSVGTVGRYELLGRLAIGGMAEIFLARESAVGAARRVVLKFIRPDVGHEEEFGQMFLNEAQVAMRLTHPNICHLYEFNCEATRYYLAMEYVDGVPLGSLFQRAIERERPLPPEVIAFIFARVAEALEFAHTARDERGRSLQIVHRDVTPHNIMVSYGGVVKLLDFGVAKVKASAAPGGTHSGSLKGKFGYMSPEQVAGTDLDGRSDVFALGICLYEALTGARLYKRSSEYETMRAVLEEPPPSVCAIRPGIDPELDAIVQRSLAKSRDDRFQSAGELQDALEGFLAYERVAVSSSRIARHMRELFAEEMRSGPRLDRHFQTTGAFVVPGLSPVPDVSDGLQVDEANIASRTWDPRTWDLRACDPRRWDLAQAKGMAKRHWPLLAGAVAVFLLLSGLAALLGDDEVAPPVSDPADPAPASPAPAPPASATGSPPAPEPAEREAPQRAAPAPIPTPPVPPPQTPRDPDPAESLGAERELAGDEATAEDDPATAHDAEGAGSMEIADGTEEPSGRAAASSEPVRQPDRNRASRRTPSTNDDRRRDRRPRRVVRDPGF